jgi:DNA-binding transcriptional ArsR family regulator
VVVHRCALPFFRPLSGRRTFKQFVEYHRPATIVNGVRDDEALDRSYAALADPTRRTLLVALRDGEARITDLARPLPLTFAAVSRHLAILEDAGLVRREVRGREHWLCIRPEGLDAAERWIREQTAFWSERADGLASRLRQRATRP